MVITYEMLAKTLHFLNQRIDFFLNRLTTCRVFRVKKNANIAFFIKEESV